MTAKIEELLLPQNVKTILIMGFGMLPTYHQSPRQASTFLRPAAESYSVVETSWMSSTCFYYITSDSVEQLRRSEFGDVAQTLVSMVPFFAQQQPLSRESASASSPLIVALSHRLFVCYNETLERTSTS